MNNLGRPMTDDGREPVEMTGRWVGFSHRWEKLGRHPIVADIRQTGNKISGEMYDQMSDRSDYFGNSVVLVAEQIPIDIRRKFERVIRRFGAETIPNSHLPDISEIQGTITGSQVRITKTYRGLETTWTAGEKQVGTFRRDGHKIQYSGDFNRDRTCIVGTWIIRQTGQLGRFLPQQARGSFELYRKEFSLKPGENLDLGDFLIEKPMSGE